MSESSKTGIIAALAAVTTLLAWSTTTRNFTTGNNVQSLYKVNQPLFEKFTDPLGAASLKIVKYNTDSDKYDEFEIGKDRKSGIWTIPSHENYPADANKQMSDAANLFVGLKALNIASEKKDEQKLFGVVEPDKKRESEGGEGVGTLVQFRDEKGDILADLIIGKQDSQDKKKRFVRVPSEDVIYVAELETNALSTDFKQWIESDLLKLSATDIETLGIRNYSLIRSGQGKLAISPNYDADIQYNVGKGKWDATSLTVYDDRAAKPRELAATEELNTTKLNDMKSALDNLRIVNVAKKPAGVASDLKGSKLTEATLEALQSRGYFASKSADGDNYDLYAANGDLHVTLKDGVQYLLRFGGKAGSTFEPVENAEGEENKASEISINRFLLVTTRVDDAKFASPVLERVPETVDELKAMEAAKNPPVVPAEPSGKDLPKDPAAGTDTPAAEAATTEKPDVPSADSSENKSEQPKQEGSTADSQASSNRADSKVRLVNFQDPPTGAKETAQLTDEEWKERLDAAKERITKDNKRKIDQHNDKLAVAKKKVAELNSRFADWYYIVSDAEFKRLKIELNDLITTKGALPPGGPPNGLPTSGLPTEGFPDFPGSR